MSSSHPGRSGEQLDEDHNRPDPRSSSRGPRQSSQSRRSTSTGSPSSSSVAGSSRERRTARAPPALADHTIFASTNNWTWPSSSSRSSSPLRPRFPPSISALGHSTGNRPRESAGHSYSAPSMNGIWEMSKPVRAGKGPIVILFREKTYWGLSTDRPIIQIERGTWCLI